MLDRSGAGRELRAKVETWRPDAVSLPDGTIVGDQWCQPPHALERCLLDGLTPRDWYDRLNGLVFLWPDEGRALRHAGTYRGRDQVLLTFDAPRLLEAHGDPAFVAGFNTGYALRRAKPRGLDAFVPYRRWLDGEGPPAVELTVEHAVPDAADFLLDVRRA